MIAVFIPLKSANTMNQPLCLFESWLVDVVCTPLVFSNIRYMLKKKRSPSKLAIKYKPDTPSAKEFRQQELLLTVTTEEGWQGSISADRAFAALVKMQEWALKPEFEF